MSDMHDTARLDPVVASEHRDDDHMTIRIPKPGGGGPMRSTLRSTEFWLTVLLVLFLLLATYLDEDSLQHVDGWRFATYAVAAYALSRGLAKLGNHRDAEHDRHR